MASPAKVIITNLTNQKITTHVIREYWIEDKGNSIDGEEIDPGETMQFHVVAKTGHHGELDINLVGNNAQILGVFKIKSIKDPQKSKSLEDHPYQDFFKMSSKGLRNIKGQDKDLRHIELEVADQVSVTAGWDIVSANQKQEVNAIIKSLYDQDVLPHQLDGVKVGCPEIVGGTADNQGAVTLKLPLDGKIKLIKVSGDCMFTINLKSISGVIERDENLSYTLLVNLKESILSNVDLSELKVILIGKEINTDAIEKIVLEFINQYVNSLEPISIPFNTPLPMALNDTSINFAFVENAIAPDSSFFAILVGLHGNKGTYQLASNVIDDPVNANTAFVFSNILFMTVCKELLNKFLGDDFKFAISRKSPYRIINKNKVTLKDGGFWGINAEIKKNDFEFSLDSENNFNVSIKLRYQTSKLLPWSSIKLKLNVKASTEAGQLVFNISSSGNPPWWLWIVLAPLAIVFNIIANKDGVVKVTVPNFYCDQVSIPSYLRLTGKWSS